MNSDTTAEHPTPEQEAVRIANAFDRHDSGSRWETAGGEGTSPYGSARVCRFDPARVLHVIGATEMAEQLRHLYRTGAVTGWTLQPMPDTRTPIHTVAGQIQDASATGRGYTQLTRAGFVHTEEVQACPDAALTGVRNIGPDTLAIIRTVLPYTGPAADDLPTPPPPARITPRSPDLTAGPDQPLSPATRIRYQWLVQGLSTSSIPEAALTKIVESLNAETLPPADPLVELLLDTAGLHELLRHYRDTHTPTD